MQLSFSISGLAMSAWDPGVWIAMVSMNIVAVARSSRASSGLPSLLQSSTCSSTGQAYGSSANTQAVRVPPSGGIIFCSRWGAHLENHPNHLNTTPLLQPCSVESATHSLQSSASCACCHALANSEIVCGDLLLEGCATGASARPRILKPLRLTSENGFWRSLKSSRTSISCVILLRPWTASISAKLWRWASKLLAYLAQWGPLQKEAQAMRVSDTVWTPDTFCIVSVRRALFRVLGTLGPGSAFLIHACEKIAMLQ